MRIALISPVPPYRGGIATFSQLLVGALRPRHEVKVMSFRKLYPEYLFPGKKQIHTHAEAQGRTSTAFLLDPLVPASWEATAGRIHAFQPDVCLFVYWMPFFIPAYWRLVSLCRRRAKTAALWHNIEEHESFPGSRWLRRRFFQSVDRLIVLSEESQRQLADLGVTTPMTTLFHPADQAYGDPQPQAEAKVALKISPEIPVILFFGLVRPYKGLTVLIEAAKKLRDQGVIFHLRVAGEFYKGYEKAVAAVSRWGLTDTVTLENRFVPDREVATYFSAADVVALPYLTASQSGVGQLAYHFDRPVVVTNVGGLAEVVEPGLTGCVVPPGDSSQLAEVLRQNLPAGFRAMRREVARVKVQYSWDKFTTQLERALK